MERKQELFGIAATFDTPDEIINAANAVSSKGYTNYDAHTPYPVHGMDKAMKLPPSKLGFITLVFGLSGAATALFFMWWTMTKAYPMVIGGKPFFALPAFIPVTFELTVLFATLSTVIGMITFFFKFPSNSYPIHDTDYLKSISHDKYGILIETSDPLFNAEKVEELFVSFGSKNISKIYAPEKKIFDALSPKFLLFLLSVFIITSGVTYIALNKLLISVPYTWMSRQNKVTAQSHSTYYIDEFGMRAPIVGTVSRGHLPYIYKDSLAQPKQPLANPLLPNVNNLALGQKMFLTYCSPCHGNLADGDSRLRGQFPTPPTLHSQKVRDWQDGNIYHVIMSGQNNIMPSYSAQLNNEEAWSVVLYVRALQKAKNASAEDINEYKKESLNNGTK